MRCFAALERLLVTLALAATTIAALGPPARAAVIGGVSVSSRFGSADESKTFDDAVAAHGVASSGPIGAAARVVPGLSPCGVCASVGSLARAFGEIDTDPMRLRVLARGEDGGEASSSVAATDTITFRGNPILGGPLPIPMSRLFVDIRIDIDRVTASRGAGPAAGADLAFSIFVPFKSEEDPGGYVFAFGAGVAEYDPDGRQDYAYATGIGMEAVEFDEIPSVFETTLELWAPTGTTMDWLIEGGAGAYSYLTGHGYADASHSFYVGLRGEFESANGYGYRGFAAPPALPLALPGTASLLLAGLPAIAFAARGAATASRVRRRPRPQV